ncbi:hypothetical protein T05_9668 [Trichinella murrelli]|uniref:Uncharacterized protein n=1 Tax=Trichinella murrelli TaxID=144512 RepID=A0A0V0TDK8_9BILA|nr:hypothetical protein T05_9668 [Trichinella murrelli]
MDLPRSIRLYVTKYFCLFDPMVNVKLIQIQLEQLHKVGWNRSRTPTTVSLATTNYIDCLPCTAAAAVTGQIVSVCLARIQKEQMFRLLSMSPAVDLLAASRFVYWSAVKCLCCAWTKSDKRCLKGREYNIFKNITRIFKKYNQ